MDRQHATGMAIIMMTIILGIVMMIITLTACKTSKHTVSVGRSAAALTQSLERRDTSSISDNIKRWLDMGADSIIFTFADDAGPMPFPVPGNSDRSAVEAGLPGSDRWSDASPASDRLQDSKAAGYIHRQSPGYKQPRLRSVKIYAPHITENSDESVVAESSSTDRSDTSLQSESEEESEQQSKVTAAGYNPLNAIIIIVFLIILLAFGARVLHRK